MSSEKNVFIIGGGQAGIYAASEIRKIDKEAKVTILGEEKFHPYERPPLSKDFLINSKKEGEFLFFSENFFEEQKIHSSKFFFFKLSNSLESENQLSNS